MRKLLTQADGRRFAIEVLRKIRKAGANKTSAIRQEDGIVYRRGPQSDALILAWDRLALGSRQAAIGFCVVLTDYVGCTLGGSVPYPECYEQDETAGKLEHWRAGK